MSRIRALPLALALAAIASASLAFAQSPLTLAEAQRRAVERSRQLAAQDASISASREMAVAAGQLPDPVLKFQLQNMPVEGPDKFSTTRDGMTMRSAGVMQEWTRGEKRDLRRERFEREAERTQAERSASTAAIQRDTALAWLDRYYAEAMAGVLAEESAAAQLEITAAESAYRAGRVNQSDVLAAHSARVGIEDRASEQGRRVRNARTMLARWVGEDAAQWPLAGKPSITQAGLEHAHVDAEIQRHPDVVALTLREQVAETDARLAQANKKADWSFELMYNQRPAYADMVSIGVSIPLQWDQPNRQDRELRAKLAMVEQARAERDEMVRSHAADIRNMLNEWQNGLERLARYDRELLPLAHERTRSALAAYQGGKVASSDLLMARRNEIDVRLQALQIEMETARLWAQLRFLVPDESRLPVASAALNAAKVSP